MAGWTEIKESPETPIATVQRWGSLSSFLLAVTFIIPPWIYLVGDLRAAIGPFAYALADFLFGPVCAASLIMTLVVLRERIGECAPRQMSLALLAAALAGAMFVTVAFVRAANREYLTHHPELETLLLPAWTTLMTGAIATGWHFLGWALLLIGSAGWAARRLPRGLSVLYMVAGIASLFVYLLPDAHGLVAIFGVMVSIWQGVVLWKAEPGATSASEITADKPDQV